MKTDTKKFYASFTSSDDTDAFRASQYDALVSDKEDPEIGQNLERLYNTLRLSFGEVTSKSVAFSIFRYVNILTDAERETARMIGLAHNSVAPEQWRMKGQTK